MRCGASRSFLKALLCISSICVFTHIEGMRNFAITKAMLRIPEYAYLRILGVCVALFYDKM